MGMTLAQKALARAAGKDNIIPGEVLTVRPDLAIRYDFPHSSDYEIRLLQQIGIERVKHPDQIVCFIDHCIPPKLPEEADLHKFTREWTKAQGIRLFEGGIGHQLTVELGLARPGMLIVHPDAHVAVLGAFGAIGIGLMRDIISVFALGEIWLEVPDSILINLKGALQDGVMSRDVVLALTAQLGPGGALHKVIEYSGPGLSGISIDGRMTLCGLVTFMGAVSGVARPDEAILEYLSQHTGDNIQLVTSDEDASYYATLDFSLSQVQPMVAAPHSPDKAVPLSQVVDIPVNQGYIGSCVSGRLEDLRIAARILDGKRITQGFRLNVVPSSNEIFLAALRDGTIEKLVKAGSFVSSPTCDYCWGRTQNLAEGDVAVSTGTLNIRGRMGNVNASIYLGSAATVAATALNGRLTDPRPYLS